MGDHRSGTSLLYILLDATECFNVVRAYHIIRFHEILANYIDQTEETAKEELSDFLKSAGQSNRIIDEVPVSADLPEEYGFLIDSNSRPKVMARTLPLFVQMCKKVQFVSDPAKPLLLKNPWDYLNIAYLKATFPRAEFIFLHRDPVRLVDSQLRAIRSLLGERSPYAALLSAWYRRLHERTWRLGLTRSLFSPRHGLGFRITQRHVRRATSYFLDVVRNLESDDYIDIRYEDLCADTRSTVEKIRYFLGLSGRADVDYTALIHPRSTPLCPEVERRSAWLYSQMQGYCQYCNYNEESCTAP
jgi:hypothetical protein